MGDESILDVKVNFFTRNFLDQIKGENIQIISHFDTDGISSATIMLQALKKIDQKFSLKIVKSLTKDLIHSLDKDKITLFLDLASGSLNEIEKAQLKKVYIIDHHEITEEIPVNVEIINPTLWDKERLSASALTYLVSKKINKTNEEYAKLALLGMTGDQLDKNIEKLCPELLENPYINKKRGLLIYPSTRPLNRVLEFSSSPFIPGVTGNIKGVMELLRECNFNPENGQYKSLIQLTDEEMERLTSAVSQRNPETRNKDLIGDFYLVKTFGRYEDARELSGKINACSKDGYPETAISICMEDVESKRKAESIHVKHKQNLISNIKFAQEAYKTEGPGYAILNAENQIKDTMIGTICSIIANSPLYKKGTIFIGMATDKQNNRTKISARIVGKEGRNAREILTTIMEDFKGDVGGHPSAAGCSIPLGKEEEFIQKVKNCFNIEQIPAQ